MHVSIASPSTRPSPLFRRVGIHIFTFEACSGFTHVTARWIAQPPKAAFVTRLQPGQSPSQTARQLPDQSTTLWVEPTSTGDTRLRNARNKIEHRLFCHITQNWRGRPLTSRSAVVELIAATTTKNGLTVRCELDANTYQKGVKVSDAEMAALNIQGDAFHPEWNYTIRPRPREAPS